MRYFQEHLVDGPIDTLAARHAALLRHGLSVDDVLALLLDEDDRRTLKRAGELLRPQYSSSCSLALPVRGKDVLFSVRVSGLSNIYLPAVQAIRQDADPELVARITQWAEQRWDLGVEYGRLKRLMVWFQHNNWTPAQVRYALPGILALLDMGSEEARNVANKVRELKRPQSMPTVHADLRAVIRAAAQTIATAQLLELEDPPKATNGQLILDLRPWDSSHLCKDYPVLGYFCAL